MSSPNVADPCESELSRCTCRLYKLAAPEYSQPNSDEKSHTLAPEQHPRVATGNNPGQEVTQDRTKVGAIDCEIHGELPPFPLPSSRWDLEQNEEDARGSDQLSL